MLTHPIRVRENGGRHIHRRRKIKKNTHTETYCRRIEANKSTADGIGWLLLVHVYYPAERGWGEIRRRIEQKRRKRMGRKMTGGVEWTATISEAKGLLSFPVRSLYYPSTLFHIPLYETFTVDDRHRAKINKFPVSFFFLLLLVGRAVRAVYADTLLLPYYIRSKTLSVIFPLSPLNGKNKNEEEKESAPFSFLCVSLLRFFPDVIKIGKKERQLPF